MNIWVTINTTWNDQVYVEVVGRVEDHTQVSIKG